ncbi:hypothetical protein [Burkholderia sp. L27(2015)]|uniref:hypothetical protein n=1 Tax=Burkholderia sp. L27(2015) TaxID=1641858 RepID=UPI00131B279E|nr:hypothetical protein [Burkholderia sp. L27(2015)]
MSKFKIGAGGGSVSEKPASAAEFVSGAAMVKSQAGSRPLKPIRLNLDLDPNIHRQLKLRAVENGISIAQLVRALITRELG